MADKDRKKTYEGVGSYRFTPRQRRYLPVKRAMDVALALVLLAVLAAPMLVIAAAVKLSGPDEPILFRQRRVGRGERLFTLYKFRSMAHGQRITAVGRFLRAASLDGVTSDVGIKDAVYYVALFSDEAKTQRVSDVKPVVFKNSTASSVTFENLAKGTYYVGETDENGTLLVSKMVNDKVIFYPEYDTTAKVEFEGNRSETASAEFTNVYVELTSGLYLSGQLTVTKKVLLNGVEGTSDETYYARVFFDKAMTSPASDVLALDLAGGTSASVTVKDLYIGETIGSSATYYVAETDKDGTPLDPDAVTEFEISIDKSEIVMDANNSAQEVVITNSYTEEETETETETEVDEKKTAPKTGDDTDFMRYLLLMALSAGTCAVAFDRKRRKARRVEK